MRSPREPKRHAVTPSKWLRTRRKQSFAIRAGSCDARETHEPSPLSFVDVVVVAVVIVANVEVDVVGETMKLEREKQGETRVKITGKNERRCGSDGG